MTIKAASLNIIKTILKTSRPFCTSRPALPVPACYQGRQRTVLLFFIQVQEAQGVYARYYTSVTDVTIAQHGGALINEEGLTLSAALATGVLQYYPTGNAQYDAARLIALDRIRELTETLNEKTAAMLSHTAALAELLDTIWDMPRDDVPWPVLYNIYSANISHLQAAFLLDHDYLKNLPAELRQTAAPLSALQAASCMEDAALHLLTALSFYTSLESVQEPSTGEAFWENVLAVWEDIETDFDEMCVTRGEIGYARI